MSTPIIFYDIPSTLPGVAWSPNTWKTRYSLNYKGIPYTTKWVEYPDIAATCKEIGAPPTSVRRDGSPFYTLPVIHNTLTGESISESAEIAEYLDKQFPDTPKLASVPKPLESAFMTAFSSLSLSAITEFALPKTMVHLNPPSKEYFLRNKFKVFSSSVPVGDAHAKLLEKMKAQLTIVDQWFKSGEAEGPYLTGKLPSYLDFYIAGYILWMKRVYGKESVEWKAMAEWHGGRWGALLESLKPYEGGILDR